MDHNLSLLYEYAATYRLSEYYALYASLGAASPALRQSMDVRLMNAQLKLFTCDDSMADDLEHAGKLQGKPIFPCLSTKWLPQDPNGFVVFRLSAGSLQRFLQALPAAKAAMEGWYGSPGRCMVQQIEGELLYFGGRWHEALPLMKDQLTHLADDCVGTLMARYVCFRSHLALGQAKEAEADMLDIIRAVKAAPQHPTCARIYKTIREWSNLTTGWCGETPRYHHIPGGPALPVLEDRVAAIQKGISTLGPTELPFVTLAALKDQDVYTVRQLYMDVFHALYHFRERDLDASQTHFRLAMRVSAASGVIMPFVEYGRQIVPLLEAFRDMEEYASLIEKMIRLAGQYERGVEAYRA